MNLRKFGVENKVHPIVKKSEDAVKDWNRSIDFLWIDGDHRYKEVKKDFDLWSPFVRAGGIIAFHDSTSGDVQKLVLEVGKKVKQIGWCHSISVFRNEAPGIFSRRFALLNLLEDYVRHIPMPRLIRNVLKSVRP
jgi:hypothetical protein